MNIELFLTKAADGDPITRHLPPAELLATEEALLDFCEDHVDHPGFLWFWEPVDYFVVLGYGKHLAVEVNEVECRARAIPILRRSSGGGTVLQGPGCLNYCLVLPCDARPEMNSITNTNIYIMEQVHTALASIVPGELSIQGHTDLTLGTRKFSGNAQRRKKRSVLFHGSFLLDFDLDLITQTLREPQQQPEYRRARSHQEFLCNISINRSAITKSFQRAWTASRRATPPTSREIAQRAGELAAQKYSQDEWNRRF